MGVSSILPFFVVKMRVRKESTRPGYVFAYAFSFEDPVRRDYAAILCRLLPDEGLCSCGVSFLEDCPQSAAAEASEWREAARRPTRVSPPMLEAVCSAASRLPVNSAARGLGELRRLVSLLSVFPPVASLTP